MQISTHIHQITAPNPGIMTGNGTNAYVIRAANGECMVIDPGPNIESHIDAILAACGGAPNLKAIVLTHMHPDHSPAAMPLQAHSNARIYSAFTLEDEFQDKSFVADMIVSHDQVITLDDLRLRCLYTPGHVDNHMCYLLENDGVVITGDHIMQGSTVVIIPPHGNMKKYIASLALLKNYPIKALAPGHGSVINEPVAEIDGLIAHRLKRENKVRERLARYKEVSLESLTADVYDDVAPQLHAWAAHSLLAHLIKLQEEGEAVQHNGHWAMKK